MPLFKGPVKGHSRDKKSMRKKKDPAPTRDSTNDVKFLRKIET